MKITKNKDNYKSTFNIPDTVLLSERLTKSLLSGKCSFIILAALATCFWWPALWHGLTTLHADAGHHGLSLLSYHSRALAGEESVLWSSRIYGGHPLFAEGQGGFANPLNIICAYLFDPVYGSGVFHWMSVLIGGLGIYNLCRILSISRWSSTFASLAVIFSSSWIHFQYNLTVSATLAWVPWLMVAAEYWLRHPSLYRAALLSVPAALLVFGGYPQLPQGVAIFLIASLFGEMLTHNSRQFIYKNWKAIIVTGTFSIAMAIGLSAVQLIPLIELVGQSHRSEGLGLPFGGLIKPLDYFSGLFYFNLGADDNSFIVGSLGSITVIILAALLIVFRVSSRMYGYMIASAFLFNLGMEYASPLFKVIYENKLIPGLHYHRIMHLFFPISVIGFSVLAACALDKIIESQLFRKKELMKNGKILYFAASTSFTLITLVIIASVARYEHSLSIINIVTPLAIISSLAILSFIKRLSWLAPVAVIIFSADILIMRSNVFNFYEHSIDTPPPLIEKVLADPDLEDYRTHDFSGLAGMVFMPAHDPNVQPMYIKYVEALSPFPGLEWNISSIDGVLALPSARRAIIRPTMEEELTTPAESRQGQRVTDILGVRYISSINPLLGTGLTFFAGDHELAIYKNEQAKPRFQVYQKFTWVDSPTEALAGLKASEQEVLFVERKKTSNIFPTDECTKCNTEAQPKYKIDIIESSSIAYRLRVELDHDAWLFLADADYPGWEASVNGQRGEVYSAQVLGKALPLKAGINDVTIEFVPWSFYVGAVVSVITAFLLAVILLIQMRRHFLKINKCRELSAS